MLRIVEELAGPGPLRICAHAPADGAAGTGLRVLLIADVLARVVEMRGRAVLMGWTGPPNTGPPAAGIRPADAEGEPEEITEALGGPPGVQLTSGTYEGGGRRLPADRRSHTARRSKASTALAVRLLLLGHPYEEPVAITADEIDEADRTLARWRRAVATGPSSRRSRSPPTSRARPAPPWTAGSTPRPSCASCATWRRRPTYRREPSSRPSPTSTASWAWNSSARWARY